MRLNLLIVCLLLTCACSRDISSPSTGSEPAVTVKNINSLTMDCQGGPMSCTGTVGGLLIFENNQLHTFCTAFVIAESLNSSILATSSHCLKENHRKLYEPTETHKDYVFAKYDVTKPNRIHFYEINSIINSEYNYTDMLGLDYAYLSTSERVNVPELNIHHNVIDRSKMLLTVTTANFDKSNMLISINDHNNCTSLADKDTFLSKIKGVFTRPKNFGIENCRFYPGNSGAPVYFNNNLAGILNSGLTTSKSQELSGFEETRQAYANNILCTEAVKINKASQNGERLIFSEKWFCQPSFIKKENFSFLTEKSDHKDIHHESHTHIDE